MNVNINVEDILMRTMPSAAKLIKENSLDINKIIGTGRNRRITKGDVLLHYSILDLLFFNEIVKPHRLRTSMSS